MRFRAFRMIAPAPIARSCCRRKGQDKIEFETRLNEGPKPVTRTYTVRAIRKQPLEMDIDFVAHGDNGPASRWAMNAKKGDFCGFAGTRAGQDL